MDGSSKRSLTYFDLHIIAPSSCIKSVKKSQSHWNGENFYKRRLDKMFNIAYPKVHKVYNLFYKMLKKLLK